MLVTSFDLFNRVNIRTWWQEHDFLSPVQQLSLFVVAPDSSEQMELLLSGLVVKQQGKLRVHNRIYELIFDSNWVERTLGVIPIRNS